MLINLGGAKSHVHWLLMPLARVLHSDDPRDASMYVGLRLGAPKPHAYACEGMHSYTLRSRKAVNGLQGHRSRAVYLHGKEHE
jgi:hypothetical protein